MQMTHSDAAAAAIATERADRDMVGKTGVALNGGYVRAEGVDKIFDSVRGSIQALHNVSFEVQAGRFAALVGASGCGKSTLLRLVSGIYEPTKGSVFVGSQKVVGPRRDVGLVFQSPNLMPWRTVERNVALPLEVGRQETTRQIGYDRVERYLKLVGLWDFRMKLPRELSGGMIQRAGIVRALVDDPSILLMDEPFGAVDVMTRDHLNYEIQALWEQTRKTILFVTHSIQEAVLLADVVFVFSARPGTIIETVNIELPRPRTREQIHTSVFFDYEEHIRRAITSPEPKT